MRKVLLIIALTIFLHPVQEARAEGKEKLPKNSVSFQEDPKKLSKSQKTQKVIEVLKVVGMNNKAVRDTVYFVEANSKDGYLVLREKRYNGVRMQLRYEMSGMQSKNVQLNFKPEGANYEINANPQSIMMHYKIEF